jgi:hypothetical protein
MVRYRRFPLHCTGATFARHYEVVRPFVVCPGTRCTGNGRNTQKRAFSSADWASPIITPPTRDIRTPTATTPVAPTSCSPTAASASSSRRLPSRRTGRWGPKATARSSRRIATDLCRGPAPVSARWHPSPRHWGWAGAVGVNACDHSMLARCGGARALWHRLFLLLKPTLPDLAACGIQAE